VAALNTVSVEDVTSTYSHFLTKGLPLSMEDLSLETRRGIFFQHDGAPPRFWSPRYGLLESAVRKSLDWSSWSNTLVAETSPLDFFLLGLIKEMTYRNKVHTREELLHRIIDAAVPQNNSTGNKVLLITSKTGIEKRGGHFEQ
jgi:hypothetical protein